MNTHLRNFYPDDVLNESSGSTASGAGVVNKSVTGESLNINNSLTNSFSSPHSGAVVGGGGGSSDSVEFDRKINLLTKKLRSYEKRRHKLVYESKQEQPTTSTNSGQQQQQTQQTTQSNSNEQAENKVSFKDKIIEIEFMNLMYYIIKRVINQTR